MVMDGRPRLCRCPASASRKALAAAWLAWLGGAKWEAREEYMTKKSSGSPAQVQCKFHAPIALGASTAANLSQLRDESISSSRRPAAWIIPARGRLFCCAAATASAVCSGSQISAVTTRMSAPSSSMAAICSLASGEGLLRPTRVNVRAPRASTNQRAVSSPRSPRPPVIR